MENSIEEDIKDIEKYISFTSKRENFSHDTDWNWNKDLALMDDEEEGIECHELAIKALEKQIPKKPIFTEDKQFALCPCCDMKGLTDKQKYCDNCGQAIDWSDEE